MRTGEGDENANTSDEVKIQVPNETTIKRKEVEGKKADRPKKEVEMAREKSPHQPAARKTDDYC